MRPYEFRTAPMDHQKRALRSIIDRGGVCGLLMDPGTGKSKCVIDYLAMLTLARGAQDWLITAPLSALDGWPDQFAQHLPNSIEYELIWLGDGAASIEDKAELIRSLPPKDLPILRVVLINHDAFGSKAKATGKGGKKLATVTVWDRIVEAVEAWSPDGMVVDESHRAKSHTAKRSKALQRIARTVPKRLLLTGTVAPRNLLDVYGQWLILNPQRFGTDWHRFRHTYARWGGWMNKEPVAWLQTEDMRERILTDAFIIKKEEALDLPPVTEVVLPVRLTPGESAAYRAMGADMLAELPSGATSIAPIPITKLMRLRQLTGGFVGYEEEGERAEERLGTSKAKLCIEKLSDLVDAGEKVVVFAHFRPDLDVLEELARRALPKATPVYRIDGDTPKRRRMEYRTGFRDHPGAAVFLAQMRTMSLGVNELVVASYGIVYSMSERRDDFDQALDRLDRQGQTRPVTIYHLIVPDSVDELLLKGHQNKLQLEQAITTRADAESFLTLGGSR